MSFYGAEFIFDGTSSYAFGLCLYARIDNTTQSSTEFASHVKMLEDRPSRRFQSYCYGGTLPESLQFKLVFGVTEGHKAMQGDFDRDEMQRIASWLTGHREYKWLQIVQDDLESVRYRCYITDLKAVEVSSMHWGFECMVNCDSPYGYLLPQRFVYEVDGSRAVVLHSNSSANDPYSPTLLIQPTETAQCAVRNLTDSNREFMLNEIPVNCGMITVDCNHGILSCEAGYNLYDVCNFKFPRLLRGDNHLVLTGSGIYTFVCTFPVNTGS